MHLAASLLKRLMCLSVEWKLYTTVHVELTLYREFTLYAGNATKLKSWSFKHTCNPSVFALLK